MLSKDPQLEHFLRKGFLLKLELNFDKITHLFHRSFLLMINNYRKYSKRMVISSILCHQLSLIIIILILVDD